jgi:DHA2 family metal-tetracycline-proton antiporter-like MFS transporter/DHA2 family florfenicol/chloramphenicol resistance protein-like MFS transporter
VLPNGGSEDERAGLVLTPGAVALAILSPMTGRLSDRVGVKAPIFAGLAIMALSILFMSTFAGASPVLIAAGILAMVLAPIVALIAAFGLRGGIGANKQSERSGEGKAR